MNNYSDDNMSIPNSLWSITTITKLGLDKYVIAIS